jgi:hypothetical protein
MFGFISAFSGTAFYQLIARFVRRFACSAFRLSTCLIRTFTAVASFLHLCSPLRNLLNLLQGFKKHQKNYNKNNAKAPDIRNAVPEAFLREIKVRGYSSIMQVILAGILFASVVEIGFKFAYL